MTKIWNRDGFVENDPWVIETEELKAGADEKPVLPLADFLVRAAESNDIGLGVLIAPADDVTRLEPISTVSNSSPSAFPLSMTAVVSATPRCCAAVLILRAR